jgi:hypothetical protein
LGGIHRAHRFNFHSVLPQTVWTIQARQTNKSKILC